MASRSHTETFILIRNRSACKYKGYFRDEDNDDERVTLVSNGKQLTSEIDLSGDDEYPSWLPNVQEFRYECQKVKLKVEQLSEIQEQHLKSKTASLFADETENPDSNSYEIDIEYKCQEINKIFNRLHALMTQIQNLANTNPYSKLLKNVFQWEVREVSDLTQQFRACQRSYINRLTEKETVDERFVITFDDANGATNSQNTGRYYDDFLQLDDTLDIPQTFQNQQMQANVPLMDIGHLRARDQEMNSIVKSIVELNQIFHDINTFVVNQGTLLDRIDFNLENVQFKIETGVVELAKAERSMRRARKMKCILTTAGLLLLMLIFLVLFNS